MKAKKISALFLAMSMLISFIVPVQAEDVTEGMTVLTQNEFSEESLAKIAEATGKTIYEYPADSYVPMVSASSDGFCETVSAVPRMLDGVIADQGWSKWASGGEEYSFDIDLGGIQTVESVLYWNNVSGYKNLGLTLTDTLWEEYKDTFDFGTMSVSTSENGLVWTEQVAATAPTTRSAATTWYEGTDATVYKVFHLHEAVLENPVSARYVRLTVAEKSGGYQFRSGEIAVLGDVTAVYEEPKTRTLISGNGIGNDYSNIEKIYSALGYDVVVADNVATYSFEESLVSNGVPEYLNQGVLGVVAIPGSHAIWSTWGRNAFPVIVDLGKNYMVSGADAEAYFEQTYQEFSKIKVEVSLDNETFTEVVPERTLVDGSNSFITKDLESSKGSTRLSINNFDPIKARYVRVTLTGGNYQVVPNEVLVFGEEISEVEDVEVSGVTLDKTSIALKVGGTDALIATVEPENATNKNVIWETSDESVATVEDGVVTAVSAGEAIITITTEDGGYIAECEVYVEEEKLLSGTCGDNLTWEVSNGLSAKKIIPEPEEWGFTPEYYYDTTDVPFPNWSVSDENNSIRVIPHGDGYAMWIKATTKAIIKASDVPTLPAGTYTISGDVKMGGSSAWPKMRIADSKTWAQWTATGNYGTLDSEWGTFTHQATVAAGTTWKPSFQIYTGTNVMLDNITITNSDGKVMWLSDFDNIDGVEPTLTITGTGDMYNYSEKNCPPWYWTRDNICNVEIGDGVTSIGNYAFAGCECLRNVIIPESVTKVGENAFKECTSLEGCTVTFDTLCDIEIDVQDVDFGGICAEPEAPERSGYIFDGWYSDEAFENAYDFANPIVKDITLYAKWTEEDDVVSGDNDPTVDGYVHAEAENATYNAESYTVMERAEASNGKLLVPVDGISPDDTVIGFDVTIPETAGYDVYALVTVVDFVATPWRMLIDGEYYNQPQGGGAGKVYAINVNFGYNRNMHWVKIAGNVELAEGETAIAAYLPAQKDSRSWLTGIDAIRIVPTKWFWAPDNTLSKPEKSENTNVPNEDGALLVEAEKSILSGVMATTKFAKASGGAYVSVKNTSSVGAASIDFETLEDETYDIWAAVATNPVNWLGGYVFTLDDTEVYNNCLATVDTEKPDLYGETIVLHTGNYSGSASTVRWVKVASKQAITAGDHTIVAATRQGSGVPNGTGLIDCIAFIPSAWGWQGSDSLALPEKPDVLPELPDDDEEEEPEYEGEWFDLEVEDGTVSLPAGVITDSTTGRTYLVANEAFSGNNSTIDFAIATDGTYDVWAVVGVDASNYIGGYTFTLNDDVFYSKSTELANKDAVGDALYTSIALAAGSHNKPMKWVKIATSKEITAGEHTLVAAVTGASLVSSNKFGAMDVVRFVPSAWEWTPNNSFDEPYDMSEEVAITSEDGVFWMDAENAIISGAGYTIGNNSNASGEKVFQVYKTDAEPITLTMNFKVEEEGEYDVKILSSQARVAHLTNYKVRIDDSEYVSTTVNSSVYNHVLPVPVSLPAYWHNVETVYLAEGIHTIVITLDDFRPLADDMMLAFIDVIGVVPSSWNWTPNGIEKPTEPVIVDVTGITLDQTEITLTEGEITTLIATVEPDDATNQNVIWTSSDENVATVEDGVVTAISAGTATITVTTEDGGYTASCVVTIDSIESIRDSLFELLSQHKNIEKAIVPRDLYEAYLTAYDVAKIAYWTVETTPENLKKAYKDLSSAYNNAINAGTVIENEAVLSGNVTTEADKELYPNLEADTLPNLTYVWTGSNGPDPEASNQDENRGFTTLLNGVGAAPYDNSPNICWGRWSWHGTTNLDFNMGEEAYVTGADFWENAGGGAGTNYCSDRVDVYTSNDGLEWTLQKSVVVDQSDTPNSLKGTRVNFDDPVKCRYVRVAVIDKAGYQVKYNEVVIRGLRTGQEFTAPIVIEDIDYATTGSKGKRVISLDGQKRVKVTGNIKNTTSEVKNVYVISAAYKDGDIIDLRYAKKELAEYDSAVFTNTMQLDEETGLTLHTFVWDSFGSATPLSKIYTFGLDEHEMADFDAEGEGAEFDINSERLRVWGTADNNGTLTDSTLIVLAAGTTNEDIDNMTRVTDILNSIVYLEQTAPEDGRVAFESYPADVAKYYGHNNVYVTSSEGEQKFYQVLYLDQNCEKALLEVFKGSDESTMRGTIDANEFFIKGVKAVDEIIAKYDKDTVLNSVAGMILDTEYDNAEELLAEILAAVALTDLNNVATKGEAIESIDRYAEEFGIAKNGIYTKLYNGEDYVEFKNEVSEKFVGQDYASIKAFIDEFYNTIIIGLINQATSYVDIIPVINEAREHLSNVGFDLDEYDSLSKSQQQLVHKDIVGRNYENIDEVSDAFNESISNVNREPIRVDVTGITLDQTEIILTEGEITTLIATVEPENATNKNVIWTSSDENVATVEDGVVTAISAGTATITVTTEDGGYEANCVVLVEGLPEPEEEQVVAPIASEESGEVEAGTTITLSTQTEGASIYYTTDGSEPTAESKLYQGAIVIGVDTTLKAIAIKDGYIDSTVSTYTYTVIEKEEPAGTPTIETTTVIGGAGDTVDVDVLLKNNPGIVSMRLKLEYDNEYVKLKTVTDAGVFGSTVHGDNTLIIPYILSWDNDTASSNFVINEKIVTLTFEIAENAPEGEYPIVITYDSSNYDIFNVDLEAVEFEVVNGSITVVELAGDVNDDGAVNALDRAVLSRYLSNWEGYDEMVNFKAADVNADGMVNTLDRAILSRYLSGWTGYETLPYKK